MIKYNEVFLEKGFFVHKNFLDKIYVKKLIKEIQSARGVQKYYDKKKNIRNITLRAMGAVKDSEGNPQTWDIQSGTEYFTNLINLDATRATKIIP